MGRRRLPAEGLLLSRFVTGKLSKILLACSALAIVVVMTPSTAWADTELIGDSWYYASTGEIDIWFCGGYEATGACIYWEYSQIQKGAALEWEQWQDPYGGIYIKMVRDGWYGYTPWPWGYDWAGAEVAGGNAQHWNSTTGGSLISIAYMTSACLWPTWPGYNPCASSNYNNNGYHYYGWHDDNYNWYNSRYGLLGTWTTYDDLVGVTIG